MQQTPWRHSLAGKLALFAIGIGVLPLVGIGGFAVWTAGQALQVTHQESVAVLNGNVTDKVRRFLGERHGDVQAFALNPTLLHAPAAVTGRQLQQLQDLYGVYDWIGVMDRQGRILAASDMTTAGRNVGQAAWFQAGLKGPAHGTVGPDPLTGTTTLPYAAPVRAADGSVVGVLSAHMRFAPINEIVTQGRLGQTGETYVIDAAGRMLTESRFAAQTTDLAKLDSPAVRATLAGKTGAGIYPDYRQQTVLGAYAPLPAYHFGVITEIDDAEALADVRHLTGIMAVAVLSVAGLVLVLGLLFARRIVAPIRQMVAQLANLAQGDADLTKRLPVTTRDEIGDLAGWFNQFTGKLHEIIAQTIRTASEVSSTAGQLSATSEQSAQASQQISESISQMAEGSGQEAQAVSQGAGETKQLTQTAAAVSLNAGTVADAARRTNQAAETGRDVLTSAVGTITALQAAMTESSDTVQRLGVLSQRIGVASSLIKGIASQTNLLALNAAIEAARAGEHGRGFAVVADEVRKLAAESNRSAEEVTGLVSEIQQQTHSVVTGIANGLHGINDGVAQIRQASQSLGEIVTAAAQTDVEVTTITRAIFALGAGLDRVADTMESVAALAEESAASAEEVTASAQEQHAATEEIAAAAQQLSGLATTLQSLVGRFKVDEQTGIRSDGRLAASGRSLLRP